MSEKTMPVTIVEPMTNIGGKLHDPGDKVVVSEKVAHKMGVAGVAKLPDGIEPIQPKLPCGAPAPVKKATLKKKK